MEEQLQKGGGGGARGWGRGMRGMGCSPDDLDPRVEGAELIDRLTPLVSWHQRLPWAPRDLNVRGDGAVPSQWRYLASPRLTGSTARPPCWLVVKASALRAEDPGFESRLR